ncbi:alpha/beta hydrolase family protein [Bacteroidota bacterium]
MIKKTFLILLSLLLAIKAFNQNSDDQYKKTLKDVLDEIEQKFEVKLKYKDELIREKWVTYADWRFRPSLEKTFINVLLPLDLMAVEQGENTYKIKNYRYPEIPVKEGIEFLEYYSTFYNDLNSWKKRKDSLRTCMYKALRLSPLPSKPDSKPIITNKREMDGYTIENLALETLPGLYVCGSIYKPIEIKGKIPVILSPNGHFVNGRYGEYMQIRCAMLAKMGAIVINYDLFAYGESLLQFQPEDHGRSLAMIIQALNSLRILDYMLSLDYSDPEKVAITGGSGGGSQTMLITALDDRIKVSVPAVMLSSFFYGGCPCESGMPTHLCGGGTNNVEIAAMAAPRPQLIISDGKDWTRFVPEIEYPYVQRIYGFYNKTNSVENAHFADEGHDYGPSKRLAMYNFLAEHLGLNIDAVKDKNGNIDESAIKIEEESAMYVFGDKGEFLPANAIKNIEELENVFNKYVIEIE